MTEEERRVILRRLRERWGLETLEGGETIRLRKLSLEEFCEALEISMFEREERERNEY